MIYITIWGIIGLYFLMMTLFHIPTFQSYMGNKTASLLSGILGTEVKVGNINPGFLNRLVIDDVLIKDQQGKEMLTIHRMGIRISLWDLLNDKISISSAQVFGAHAEFYQTTPDSAPNFQFALDSLASKDTTSQTPLDLHINSLIMRHSSVRFDRIYAPQTPQQLNPSHLYVKDISAYIILKNLTPDTININVKKLTFMEQSGLKIDKLSLMFDGGRSHSHLHHLSIKMPGTDFHVQDVEANYQVTDNNRLLMPSLIYKGEILSSHIRLSDLACLLPSFKTFNSTLSINSTFKGQGYDLEIPTLNVNSSTGDVNILCDGWIKNLHQRPHWQVNIQDLALSAKTLEFVSGNMKGKQIDVPPIIARMGDIHLKGNAIGDGGEQINAQQHIRSGIGNAVLLFSMNSRQEFTGELQTEGINLRQLLNDEQFGTLATNLNLTGCLAKDNTHIHAEGVINKLEYNNYLYHNININGSYAQDAIEGIVSIDDPNINLQIDGVYHTGISTDLQMKANIRDFSPQATHFSNQWKDARFSANINATLTGSDLNDIKGFLNVNHFTMNAMESNYEIDDFLLQTGFEDKTHYMLIKSDFADVEIRGDFNYHTLSQSFTNFLASQMPTLPGLPKVNPDTHNNFIINATIHDSDWLRHLAQIPLRITKPVTLEGFVNDNMRNINMECEIPFFYYNESGYQNGQIRITTPNDSLAYRISITKLMENGNHFDLSLKGIAHENHLTSSFAWDNHATEGMSGELNSIANFFTTPDGRQTALFNIAPSHLNVHNTQWNAEPCTITYSDKRLQVDDFNIHHDDQHLTVNGTASEYYNDSLVVNLKNIDVNYILELVNFDAVSFDGLATGHAIAKGVFGKQLKAYSDLTVNNFLFEHGRMGTLNAHANWNEDKEQMDIHAIANDGEDAITYVDGYVSPTNDYLDLNIKATGTHIDFMHSFTQSFTSKVEGHANGALRLYGPLSLINLTGELVVNGEAHIKPVGCTYQLRNDTIRMIPNEVEFIHCPIYDVNDHQGIITGGIHHNYLTNLSYDLYINTQDMLIYDFPDFGDDTFYGTVYGAGDVGIHGRSNEVVIDLNITPLHNSIFVYNVDQNDISNQEFIQWGIKEKTEAILSGQKPQITAMPAEENSDIHINFLINCTPNATMRLLMDSHTNDYITLHGNGGIRATWFNKGGVQMFGTYQVTDGTYNITIQNIIKKNFTFQEGGTIVFGGDPYEATLNLQAIHTVNGVSLSDLNVGRSFSNTVRVNCLMNISGQPSQPIVDFDLDMPNVNSDEKQMVRSFINSQDEMNQQVLYLLAIGRFYPQGANNAESNTQQSQTSLAMQSLLSGTLSGQINSILKSVIKSNDWSFGANISTGDEGWNNAEYEGLISGKLLNNRLLINGQFGYRDNATTASPSFIGDFDIRYLLLPNGNLALKVYNQTNDRYFTKSSLNTQGIGFIMKKDFNGWNDIFGTKNKKVKK